MTLSGTLTLMPRKGEKLSPEAITRRTATRRANGGYDKKTELYKTPTYNSWDNMIQRCENPNRREYAWYGARGVSVHPTWRDFATFVRDMGERPAGRTLDRINVNGDYEPGNCRWATVDEQLQNRRPRTVFMMTRVNECGHPERPHHSRGKCDRCYRRERRSRGLR